MKTIKQASVALFAIALALAVLGAPSWAIAQSGTWASKASMPAARSGMAVAQINGILYAAGGQSANDCTFLNRVEAYDPATDTWVTKPPMPTRRVALAAGVINGVLYAVGGSIGCGPRTGALEAYDPATDTWIAKSSMPTPREGLVAGVINGILYAVGGVDASGNSLGIVEAYNAATNTWTTKASLPTPRNSAAGAVVNGILYVAGGISSVGCGPCDTLQAYDPLTDTWTTKASMPTARHSVAADTANGILYVMGGRAASGSDVSTVEAFNPATDSWTSMAPMPTPRQQLGVGAVNGVLYAIGGFDTPSNSWLATNEAFTPEVTQITVAIDIKPGSSPNSINLSSAGVVPVAILGSATFDATQVDPESVTLAGAAVRLIGRGSKFACSKEDVNGDGLVDLICHVETAQFMIEPGSTSALMTGTTFDGRQIRGEDSIQIVQ